jgi:hypothetical protein
MTELMTKPATQMELKQAGELFLQAAKELVIQGEEHYLKVADGIKTIKATAKQVEAEFKQSIEDANAEHKRLTALRGSYLKPLEEAEKLIKQKMGAYTMEKERKQREAQAAQRRAEEEERKRLEDEAKAMADQGDLFGAMEVQEQAESMVAVQVEIAPPKVEGVTYISDWEVTVTDKDMVPVEVAGVILRPVDEAAVKRVVKLMKGGIKIPGVSIKEIKSVRVGR